MSNKAWQLNALTRLLRLNDSEKKSWSHFDNKSVKIRFNQIVENNRIIEPQINLRLECLSGDYWRVWILPLNGITLDIYANMPKMLFDKLVYHSIVSQRQVSQIISKW